uniref:Uncharacterized protein n=1 Tax=Timema cristinae TaxID=61476 RepID=A0A7R9H9Z3_TIMCR|nr:unnamed protein product [Timema cristinae]
MGPVKHKHHLPNIIDLAKHIEQQTSDHINHTRATANTESSAASRRYRPPPPLPCSIRPTSKKRKDEKKMVTARFCRNNIECSSAARALPSHVPLLFDECAPCKRPSVEEDVTLGRGWDHEKHRSKVNEDGMRYLRNVCGKIRMAESVTNRDVSFMNQRANMNETSTNSLPVSLLAYSSKQWIKQHDEVVFVNVKQPTDLRVIILVKAYRLTLATRTNSHLGQHVGSTSHALHLTTAVNIMSAIMIFNRDITTRKVLAHNKHEIFKTRGGVPNFIKDPVLDKIEDMLTISIKGLDSDFDIDTIIQGNYELNSQSDWSSWTPTSLKLPVTPALKVPFDRPVNKSSVLSTEVQKSWSSRRRPFLKRKLVEDQCAEARCQLIQLQYDTFKREAEQRALDREMKLKRDEEEHVFLVSVPVGYLPAKSNAPLSIVSLYHCVPVAEHVVVHHHPSLLGQHVLQDPVGGHPLYFGKLYCAA